MTLSSEEIGKKKFDSKMRGYAPTEVDAFLKEVTESMAELEEKNKELSDQVKSNEEKLKYFTDLKDSLNKSILVAQEAADKVKNNAKKEAEIVVREAQKQATDIVSEANDKANMVIESAASSTKKLTTETNDLKKQTRVFRQRLQVMLESQLEVVKSSDWDELLATDDLTDYDEIEKILGSNLDTDSDESVQSASTDVAPEESQASSTEATEDSAAQAGETVVIFPDDPEKDDN